MPVYCGEFWCRFRTAFENDRGGDRWIGDMLENFSVTAMSAFNYHAYHDGSFGLYEGGGLPSPAGRNDTLYQVLVEKLKKYTE